MDLHGQSEHLRWIGALPDLLLKSSVRREAKLGHRSQLMAAMGHVHRKDFIVPRGETCDREAANEKCYGMVRSLLGLKT